MARRDFPRRIDALAAVVAFTDDALAGLALDDARRHTVHFAIEELFTNMVKYAPAGDPVITIDIDRRDGGADILLIDAGVEPFDPTRAPDVRTDGAAADREPGGLGLHPVRRTVGSLRYAYDASRREGRTSFRVEAAPC